MAEAQKQTTGNFCWIEVGTTDARKAKSFYSQLFGWQTEDVPAGPMTYTLLRKNGKDVGGLYEMSPEMKAQNVPPHWLSYVAVESADAAAKKAATLGGKITMDAMDVMEHGRMAVVQDPTGATVAVWQSKKHGGAAVSEDPGTVCWTELATRDTRAAAKFYSQLFDWKGTEQPAGPNATYTMWMNGEAPTAGMYEMDAKMAGAPARWMPYFRVEDCDAAAAEAKKLGGTVCVEPSDIPNIGRFSVLQDPTGAAFAVIKLVQM
jgi:predicted enzyme related to lactoylglutathione lyase